MWMTLIIIVFCGMVFWWMCGKDIWEDAFWDAGPAFLNGLWLGILTGVVLMFAISSIMALSIGHVTEVYKTEPVYKVVIYDERQITDAFYLWQEPGVSSVSFLTKYKNGYKAMTTSQDEIIYDEKAKPQYVTYKYVINKPWGKYWWPLRGKFTRVIVPDKTVKLNFDM